MYNMHLIFGRGNNFRVVPILLVIWHHSVAVYFCPVWARCSYTNLIDTQLHSAVRLISSCLQPTQLSWLPVLSNVAPPVFYAVKRQLMICFKSSKPVQIGLCVLMSLSIHLHGLHLDVQYGQTWHLLTQLCSRERTGRQLLWSATLLLPTLLSDSQVSIFLVTHGLWRWTESTPWSGWWCSHMAGISDCSTREINNNVML